MAKTSTNNIVLGSVFFGGGALLTLATYAQATRSGGIYVIAYGAIITGAIQLFIGLRQAGQNSDAAQKN